MDDKKKRAKLEKLMHEILTVEHKEALIKDYLTHVTYEYSKSKKLGKKLEPF